jgi:outer membrane protein assembly factor BamB
VGSADGCVYAFEAGTGRPLWTFRVAPSKRWIPVYGNLISTWPVAGGVVVQNGVVYAAAGIAHYDGTYVVALDAVTGKVKWCNSSSGQLSEKTGSGISVQGNLFMQAGELRFLGGNVHETARYDLETGKCLNDPYDHVGTRFRTAFRPYYPQYGQYSSLHHTFPDGRTLDYSVNHAAYQGEWHSPLTLLASGTTTRKKEVTRQPRAGTRARQREIIWQDESKSRFNSFVITPDVLLIAGHKGVDNTDSPFLAAINVEDGSNIWRSHLPHAVVKGGMAVDHQRRIIVSLDGGEVHCFAPVVESE